MNAMGRQSSAVRMPSPGPVAHITRVADAMHALLVKRADQLEGCTEGSAEEVEYGQIPEPGDPILEKALERVPKVG